jgi:adenine-specific DNA-methyltransferase
MPRKPGTRPLNLIRPHEVELNRVRELLRDIVPTASSEARLEFARAFCRIAVTRWWAACCGGSTSLGGCAPCPFALGPLETEVVERAETLGRDLAIVPQPLATYLLSTLYAGLLPDERRASGGVFYTPPALVERLLNMVEEAGVQWHEHRILDPAAGGGAFLAPVAERMAARLVERGASPHDIVVHVAQHLTGVELDPFSAWMSHVFLESALWEHCIAAKERLPAMILVQDALTLPDGWRGGYDLVIGNPPYARVTLDACTRRRFARSLYGHANLYGVFTDLAVRLARLGGVIGYVTPASFLGGQYFKELRGLLLREAPPAAIDFVADRGGVFDDVLQETVLVVLARGARQGRVSIHASRPSSISAPCRTTRVGEVELSTTADEPWTLPRTRDDAVLLDHLRAMPYRLADYDVRVSTGPLVWNRHKNQLASTRSEGCYPLLWAESVLPGGRFEFRAQRKNHEPYFRILPGQNHLMIDSPVVLLQRTTAKEQSRRLIAAVLPQSFLDEFKGVVVENHLNVIRPSGVRARVPLGSIAALLNSEIVDTIFRCTSGSVAVSAYELESIPVPPPEIMQQLHALVESGAAPGTIETFLCRAYGQATEAAA